MHVPLLTRNRSLTPSAFGSPCTSAALSRSVSVESNVWCTASQAGDRDAESACEFGPAPSDSQATVADFEVVLPSVATAPPTTYMLTYREFLRTRLKLPWLWLALLNVAACACDFADQVLTGIAVYQGSDANKYVDLALEFCSASFWLVGGILMIFDVDPERFPFMGLGKCPEATPAIDEDITNNLDVLEERLMWQIKHHVAHLESRLGQLELARYRHTRAGSVMSEHEQAAMSFEVRAAWRVEDHLVDLEARLREVEGCLSDFGTEPGDSVSGQMLDELDQVDDLETCIRELEDTIEGAPQTSVDDLVQFTGEDGAVNMSDEPFGLGLGDPGCFSAHVDVLASMQVEVTELGLPDQLQTIDEDLPMPTVPKEEVNTLPRVGRHNLSSRITEVETLIAKIVSLLATSPALSQQLRMRLKATTCKALRINVAAQKASQRRYVMPNRVGLRLRPRGLSKGPLAPSSRIWTLRSPQLSGALDRKRNVKGLNGVTSPQN